MQQPQEPKPLTKFLNSFSQFLSRSRLVLLAIVVALAAFFVGYFVWTGVNRRVNERSTLLAEQAQVKYEEWQSMEEGGPKDEAEAALLESLGAIIRQYPQRYATQRALFLRAHLHAGKENWQGAAEDFRDLARSFPQSYLAPIGLFNAAIADEEQGKADEALGSYKQLTELYPKSYLVPHALFSMGRLYEEKQDFTQAAATYNKLADDYPASNWTKAGRNRIIELQVQGKIAAK